MLLILLLFPSLFVYGDVVGKAMDSNIQYIEQLNNQVNLNVNLLFSPTGPHQFHSLFRWGTAPHFAGGRLGEELHRAL